jgi:membrane dipeptidase
MARRMIIDAHEDIAFNALALGRDFRTSALEKRKLEGDRPRDGAASIGLTEAINGNVRVIFSTIYVSPSDGPHAVPGQSYSTPQEAERQARDQLAYYDMLAMDPRIALIKTRGGLEDVVNSSEPRVGLIILMEGADPIVQPKDAAEWFASGVRIVGPAWHRTRYAGGTGAPGPLTDIGRMLMGELSRAGFILDTSHLAEASFFEALGIFEGTVIASHSNARALVPGDRQLSDEMIRALVERDGVVGTVFWNGFLRPGWRDGGSDKEKETLRTVVDEMRYVCDLVGDSKHVGIGTDLDGGFGAESIPKEIDTVADLEKLAEALSAANFTDEDVDNILSGNWLRVLRRALPAG